MSSDYSNAFQYVWRDYSGQGHVQPCYLSYIFTANAQFQSVALLVLLGLGIAATQTTWWILIRWMLAVTSASSTL